MLGLETAYILVVRRLGIRQGAVRARTFPFAQYAQNIIEKEKKLCQKK